MSNRRCLAVIAAIGARTPVGRSAMASAAAVRAGVSALGAHPTMVDHTGDPFQIAMDSELVESTRLARMTQLAVSALEEVLVALPQSDQPVPVVVGLPEAGPWFTDEHAAELCQRLAARFPGRRLGVQATLDGSAAGMLALEYAIGWLADNRDACCIIGGVDSFIDADVLESLDDAGHLASSSRRWGFPPGEGAGMLALCDVAFARRHQLTVLGTVVAVATGQEANRIHTETICVGIGLADVLRRAALAAGEPITTQYCDLNGERYREHEFSYAALRMPNHAFVNAVDYVAPVDCWGHVGAASAPLLLMLPLVHHARGAHVGAFPMVWCGSDAGLRGAAVLELERRT